MFPANVHVLYNVLCSFNGDMNRNHLLVQRKEIDLKPNGKDQQLMDKKHLNSVVLDV